MRELLKVGAAAVASLVLCASASAAVHAKPPPGAVQLSPDLLMQIGDVSCGQVKGAWLPGRDLGSGYFISHTATIRNYEQQEAKLKKQAKKFERLAADAEGADVKHYLAKAKALRKKAKKAAKQESIYRHLSDEQGAVCAGGPPLRFDLKGAIGLALKPSGSAKQAASGGSNLQVVEGDGETRDALASGTATVGDIVIGPGGTTYIIFPTPTSLPGPPPAGSIGQSDCVVAQVDPTSGEPVCVAANVRPAVNGVEANPNSPVQFDGLGGVYINGYANGSSQSILRKYSGGTTTDLVTDNVYISDFLVLPDASVLMSGWSNATQAHWIRRITPAGGLQTLASTNSAFLKPYPDGNVYVGLGGTVTGVDRYLPASNAMESKYWITDTRDPGAPEAYFHAQDYCDGTLLQTRAGFCTTHGAGVRQTFQTAGGSVYVIAGGRGQPGTLAQYYPTLSFPTTSLNITVAQAAGNDIALAGLNASGQNVLNLYSPSTDTERQLIGPDQETEIYHLNYVADGNRILFDGLRFADNKYVLGQVDLDTGEVSFPATSATKWKDFQTFG